MEKYDLDKFGESIRNKIYSIRGFQVMLDRDLAEMYGVETRVLKQAVKRNRVKFPDDFMFELTDSEIRHMVSQFVIPSKQVLGGSLPFAFTQEGVAMLSSLLKSEAAVLISVRIMRAFVEMRKYILSNAQIFGRLDNIEFRLLGHDQKFNTLFNELESQEIKPKQGIFFENQVYEAYQFVSDIIKTEHNSILIIDNYVDDSILIIMTKRKKNVKAVIYTRKITEQFRHDIRKFNEQYDPVEVIEFDNSHDRFIVIDEKTIYHFGASLKDLGKKWFAFSKMDIEAVELLKKLRK